MDELMRTFRKAAAGLKECAEYTAGVRRTRDPVREDERMRRR